MRFAITGVIDFKTALPLQKQGQFVIEQSSDPAIDFSQCEGSNSVGLALMLSWVKFAKQNNKTCRFTHVPEALLSMANLYNVATILGLTHHG